METNFQPVMHWNLLQFPEIYRPGICEDYCALDGECAPKDYFLPPKLAIQDRTYLQAEFSAGDYGPVNDRAIKIEDYSETQGKLWVEPLDRYQRGMPFEGHPTEQTLASDSEGPMDSGIMYGMAQFEGDNLREEQGWGAFNGDWELAAKRNPVRSLSQDVYTTEPHDIKYDQNRRDSSSTQKTADFEKELEYYNRERFLQSPEASPKSQERTCDLEQSYGRMKRYRNLRKVANRPKMLPFNSSPGRLYLPTRIEIVGARIEDINQVPWSLLELRDGRRIMRFEARQFGLLIHGSFHIVGLAKEHPIMAPAPKGVDATEVSCLQYAQNDNGVPRYYYYITSVELVNIIDTLINIKVMDPRSRRREKGRIRLNLLPFWLKISLGSTKSIEEQDWADPRTQFARRISNYDLRKPRCLDKDVRVLSWLKLVPALQRAMQCYYTEIPVDEIGEYEGGQAGF